MNQINQPKIKYFIYCRKSSEAEDRQALSISSQIDENKKTAQINNLEIIEILEESKSAKHPGRPIFDRMLADIEKGKANGILVWNPNRISRNSIDTGRVIYLMDLGKLVEVRTPSQIFKDNPNDKFLLNLFCSQAKLENDNKGVDVKRGLRKKATMGYPSGLAKIGYLNDKTEEKGNRTWCDDPQRWPLVKAIFDRFATNKYSVRQLWLYAKNELHLTTPERKREGGKPISLSYLYSMLADPLYTGFFYQGGERYELNLKLTRMLTEDQYWINQKRLGKNGRPQPKKRKGVYNYFMQCGYCGGLTNPDFKFQLICPQCKYKFSYINRENCPNCGIKINEMNNPIYLEYVYYRGLKCRKHEHQECLNKSFEQRKIDETLVNYYTENLQISNELSEWCIKHIEELPDPELKNLEVINNAKENIEATIKKKLNRLLEERLRRDNLSQVEIELFDNQEQKLINELATTKKENSENNDRFDLEKVKKDFSLAAKIVDVIKNGTNDEKREALYVLCANLIFKNKNIDIISTKSITAVINGLKQAKAINSLFEPKNIKNLSDENEVFASVRPTLLISTLPVERFLSKIREFYPCIRGSFTPSFG